LPKFIVQSWVTSAMKRHVRAPCIYLGEFIFE
jgi:hypothetical protein